MMTAVQRDLPSGTVSFLFTDVEGSTRLLQELGAEGYAEALAGHRRVLRQAFSAHGGVEVDTQGDAFFVAFPTAPGALRAAAEALEGLAAGPIRVRMGVHTGTPYLGEEGYVGVDVHRAARIAACGHGGQVLVSASTAALADDDGLRDLGEHRLKDLSAPERIYQLGEGEFPPLKSLYRTNLPIPATPFLGRESELSEVRALLEDTRLLTLSGPGGTGKTRLALQAAAEVADDYPDGIFWVPLAPLSDPALVLETAAQALGTQDGLADHVSDKTLLLLLDNFEHLVAAAEELPALLAACPNLRLVVTSRERLRIPGEQTYPVPPLEPADGVDLFLARARAAQPDFGATATVNELCARLEQLPLALELAAARVPVLSPEQLLERLSQRLDLLKAGRSVDPRQQTLRATIEWSHELLNTEEQRLFARLAVFAGGCTLEAAEAICDANVDEHQSLVDKSLVRVREGHRFWMLETIREYAAERLDESSEAEELRRRHADYFLALAERAELELESGRVAERLERLDAEDDNLRAALATFRAQAAFDLLLRLAGALRRFWYFRGHFVEGGRWLEDALARTGAEAAGYRVKALQGAYQMSFRRGDYERAQGFCEERLGLCRELGDLQGIVTALRGLSNIVAAQGERERAERLQEESLALAREIGDGRSVAMALGNLATTSRECGDYERAELLAEESLATARAIGDTEMTGVALVELGLVRLRVLEADEAPAPLREGLELAHRLGDVVMTAEALEGAAAFALTAGKAEAAARILGAAEQLRGAHWLALEPEDREWHDRTIAATREALGEAAFVDERGAGTAMSRDQAVEYALNLLA